MDSTNPKEREIAQTGEGSSVNVEDLSKKQLNSSTDPVSHETDSQLNYNNTNKIDADITVDSNDQYNQQEQKSLNQSSKNEDDFSSNTSDKKLNLSEEIDQPETNSRQVTNANTDTNMDVDTDVNTDTNMDIETSMDKDTNTDISRDTYMHSDTDTVMDAEMDAEIDRETQTETKIETETDRETETKTETDTDTEMETDKEIKTEIEMDTDTETDKEIKTETEMDTEMDTDTDTDTQTETETETEFLFNKENIEDVPSIGEDLDRLFNTQCSIEEGARSLFRFNIDFFDIDTYLALGLLAGIFLIIAKLFAKKRNKL